MFPSFLIIYNAMHLMLVLYPQIFPNTVTISQENKIFYDFPLFLCFFNAAPRCQPVFSPGTADFLGPKRLCRRSLSSDQMQ
jgi:hypothetical protein